MSNAGLQFGVLGPLQLRAGETVVPLGAPKQRAVLATLLMNRNRAVSVDAYRLPPDRVAGLLGQAGLVMRARLLREPDEATETDQRASLLARKPLPSPGAARRGRRLRAGMPRSTEGSRAWPVSSRRLREAFAMAGILPVRWGS